ncbi:MAG: methyltransferase domain-containing protein [bacterium]|nr:methyltransferase domain-containing protein [bacterium]
MKPISACIGRIGTWMILLGGLIHVFAWRLGEKGARSAWYYFRFRLNRAYVARRNRWGQSNRVECPCCGWKGYDFIPLDGVSFWVARFECPSCGAYDRHRGMQVYVDRHDPDLLSRSGFAVHYAPERQVTDILGRNPDLAYAASDLGLERLQPVKGRAFQSNILAIPCRDNSVDVVFCIHLLEHLKDDTEGIAEIHRILKPGGIAYLMVPIDLRNEETVYFGRPHPEIFDHYYSHARDFIQKLDAFEVQELKPGDYLSPAEQFRFGMPDKEIFHRCVKR